MSSAPGAAVGGGKGAVGLRLAAGGRGLGQLPLLRYRGSNRLTHAGRWLPGPFGGALLSAARRDQGDEADDGQTQGAAHGGTPTRSCGVETPRPRRLVARQSETAG